MVDENLTASKMHRRRRLKMHRRRGLTKTAATTSLVALLVISTAGWLYFLGKIGRALISRLLT